MQFSVVVFPQPEGPQERDEFPGVDSEGDPVHRRYPVEPLA
jgi:hypothetical protein